MSAGASCSRWRREASSSSSGARALDRWRAWRWSCTRGFTTCAGGWTRHERLETRRGAAMSLLQVKGLRRDFGALRAVDDVTFELAAGTILGFIGPNGAGKSTTMRIIATLDTPSAGEVLLDGQSVVDA